MYVLTWRTIYVLTRVLFWCLYPKITLEWAHKQFVTRVHTLFYFLHDTTNPWMTLTTRIFTHHPRVSLARLTFCWWRHNRLAMTWQWPDNCDANTWQVISNSLDIDFIHGDIHGRSCKKSLLTCLCINMYCEKLTSCRHRPELLFPTTHFPCVRATWTPHGYDIWKLCYSLDNVVGKW